MRIAFIASRLAPGQDAMGDYTHRLAGVGKELEHACAKVTLNDRFVVNGDAKLPSVATEPHNAILAAQRTAHLDPNRHLKINTSGSGKKRVGARMRGADSPKYKHCN